MTTEHIHFVTGRLAEQSLNQVVQSLARDAGFDYSIDVLPITVAALMTPAWIARRIQAPPQATRILIPGYCAGDLAAVEQATARPVERGPRDLRELPSYFGRHPATSDYGRYDIEIIAEINHCPRLTISQVLETAERLSHDGADLIDVGCDPGSTFSGVGDLVRALVDAGHRVAIDSWNPQEIAPAVAAGAELVLSVSASNRDAAGDWGCEVVAVPDQPHNLGSLDATVAHLEQAGVAYRLDPVLEPIGFGFAASLARYTATRARYPQASMMMGIGNLTELTDVDSAGVNVMLLGFCQELQIRSVLTTQVINWARSSVRECDLARRLVYHAVANQELPKHLEPQLVVLRDPERLDASADELQTLAEQIKDNNYRIFVAGDQIHLLAAGLHLSDTDPFALFDRLMKSGPQGAPPRNIDPGHAFYLGHELSKAVTALTLGKQYEQDEALNWGHLTRAEKHLYLGKGRR